MVFYPSALISYTWNKNLGTRQSWERNVLTIPKLWFPLAQKIKDSAPKRRKVILRRLVEIGLWNGTHAHRLPLVTEGSIYVGFVTKKKLFSDEIPRRKTWHGRRRYVHFLSLTKALGVFYCRYCILESCYCHAFEWLPYKRERKALTLQSYDWWAQKKLITKALFIITMF